MIHGKEAASGAVLRRHVGYGSAVGQAQVRKARAVELDELAHAAVLPEHLDDSQGHVSGCDAGLHGARELESDDLWQ